MAKTGSRPSAPISNGAGLPAKRAPVVNTLPEAGDPLDIVRKFTRENPKGTLPDAPEQIEGAIEFPQEEPGIESPAPTEQPQEPTEVSEAPEQPAEQSAPAVPETPAQPEGKTPKVADKPAEPAKPVAETTPVAAEPPKPSYAPDEKIYLLEGSEPWTREQVVAGLQERATLQPKAAEAEQYHSLFGFDTYSKAEAEWKPLIETIRTNPEGAQLADVVLHADPALANYVKQSIAYWNSPEGLEARGVSPEQVRQTQQPEPAKDPRVDKMERTFQAMQKQAIDLRVRNEWGQVYEKYPFLRDDPKARQALTNAAGLLFSTDEKTGKDPLECRGLLDAMAENAVFLESMAVAFANRSQAAPARENPPAVEPNPNVGPEALLGSGGPGPSGARAHTPPKLYKGPADDAVSAFVNDFPGN